MSLISHPSVEAFVRRIGSFTKLDDQERAALASLPVRESHFNADQDIVREGDRPDRMFFIVGGVACSYKMLLESRRQIVAFHILGDAPDLQSLHINQLDMSVAAITPCHVGFVEHSAILSLCARHPRIIHALWRYTLIDASIFREWMASIGQRSAPARIAHLFCELMVRHAAVGLVRDGTISFPMTQMEIGDALGLSAVHINRSIQLLRRRQLITLRDGQLKVTDWTGLRRLAGFDQAYLHLGEEFGNLP